MSDQEKYLKLLNHYSEIQKKNKNNQISDERKRKLESLIDSGELFKEIGLDVEGKDKINNQKKNIKPKLTTHHNVGLMTIHPYDCVQYSKETQTRSNHLLNQQLEADSPNLGRVVSPKLLTALEWDDEFEMKFVDPAINSESTKENANNNKKKLLTEDDKNEVLGSDDFLDFFERATVLVENCISSNAVDIFTDYSGNFDDEISLADTKGILELTRTVSDERWTRNRAVTSLEWQNQGQITGTGTNSSGSQDQLLLVSYFHNDQEITHELDGLCLLWNVARMTGSGSGGGGGLSNSHMSTPDHILHYQSPIITAHFAGDIYPNLIIGGTYSGQIVIWDIRTNKRTPIQRSHLSVSSHTHPVVSLASIGVNGAKDGLVTLSTDGKMCSWRIEMINQPVGSVQLQNTRAKEVNSTCMQLLPGENQGDRFMVGSEDGHVYVGSRSGSKPGECVPLLDPAMQTNFLASSGSGSGPSFQSGGISSHSGPIMCVAATNYSYMSNSYRMMRQTSANANDLVLNNGMTTAAGGNMGSNLYLTSSVDYSVKLWSDRHSHSVPALLFTFEDHNDYIYHVDWSPTHPGRFATVDGSGRLEMWNLLSTFEEPIAKEIVDSQCALSRCVWHKSGSLIATGDDIGRVRLFNVNEAIIQQPKHLEWSDLDSLIDHLHFESLSNVPYKDFF